MRVADTATGGADGSRSADGFDDPGALALAEDFASGLVMAENRSAAERCRGVHTVYLRHEERVRAHLAEAPPGEPEWAQLDPFEHACQSLVAVTGVSYARSQDMVLLAIDVHDWAGPVLDAMASGLMCERIAMLLCRKVRGVDDPLRAEVLAAVVADYLRRLRDGERPSRQATSRNAGKIVADLDPEGVARRREDAAFTRAVRFRKDDDEGMCTMTARLTSAAGALLAERIDAFAGKAAPGDRRTLAQRRADALEAMATGEHIVVKAAHGAGPGAKAGDDLRGTATGNSAGNSAAGNTAGNSAAGNTSGTADRPADDAPAEPSGAAASRGASNPVNVYPVLRPHITVIATGTGAPRIEFARTGESSMEALCRLLESAKGTRFELVDTRPGTHDRPERAKKYRISPELARRIRARDGTCRHPGCSVPAEQCDVDHIVPFDHSDPEKGGLTLERNLMCLCRRHHRYKTFTKARYEYMNEGRIRILIDRHILTTEPTGPLARARSWRPMSTNRDGSGATGRPGRPGRSPSAQPPTSGPPPSGPPPPRPGTPPDDAPPPF